MMEEKERILRHAQEKFFREGFYKTTMDELSSELRMSKKTIYKYFPSKEKLVEEITRNFREGVAAELTGIFKSSEPAVSKMIDIMRFLGAMIFRISDKMLLDLQVHYPALWIEIDEFRTKLMTKNMTQLVKQGKKEGFFADYPEDLIVTIFISSIRAVVNPAFLINHRHSYQHTLETAFSILLNGVITDKGKKIINHSKNRIKK